MKTADRDPGRVLAQIALSNSGFQPREMLEEAVRYAFDQLCFHSTTPQLEALMGELQQLLGEDA
jgi:hypothetical protein